MKFENLRLVGFKSFVEPTDFEIRSGLTGIVGPNGCGKSNLLESLRWVMGATSAKALRGDGMDAVIFSGTRDRPARNWAEVTLAVENTNRNLPAEFNHFEKLEVSRRILRKEEGSQSIYKVNGKEVRAKDVQLLFADASTGANSPALVRQGQIAELINAKPQNRRRLLEEAAGITGLYTRRHESELRLRAAENNLARLDDVTGELETQRQALARQARQATRYRNLSGHIRRAEALSTYMRWHEATQALQSIALERQEIFSLLEETARVAAAASAHQTRAHEALEPLRMEEAEAGAALHRLKVALEQLETEADRLQAEKERLQADKDRVAEDLTREKSLREDAENALEALEAEVASLSDRQMAEEARLIDAEATYTKAAEALDLAENAFEQASNEAAAHDAERRVLTTRAQESEHRLNKLHQEIDRLTQEREGLTPDSHQADHIDQARREMVEAEESLTSTEAGVLQLEETRKLHASTEETMRSQLQSAQKSVAELKAEYDALTRLLSSSMNGDYPAIIDKVRAKSGYELALAAALGDDLSAATEQDAPAHWSPLGEHGLPAQNLPDGVEALIQHVDAPAALHRRLSQIGIIDAADADRLVEQLTYGQRLVSCAGDVWRWDGLVTQAEAKTTAAIRLEQKNRLGIVSSELAAAEKNLSAISADHEAAQHTVLEAVKEEEQARRTLTQARKQLTQAQTAFVAIERDYERTNAKLISIEENVARLRSETQEIETARSKALEQLEKIPDVTALQAEVVKKRENLVQCRAAASEARAIQSDLQRESQSRSVRLEAIGRERGVWTSRHETALSRIEELAERLELAGKKHQEAIDAPDNFAEKRNHLLEKIEALESRATVARDTMAEAQQNVIDADRLLKEAEAEAVSAREAKARIEAQHEAGLIRVQEAAELSRENCEADPEELLAIAEIDDETALPTRPEIDAKLEKLKNEREKLGGVNLCADQEMEEIDERLDLISTEREDCDAAIRKLRAAIGGLNREGRQRLIQAFETVNQNFQSLFTRLFGGGQAELRLIDSEDPLEAGLEIFASPPGKKLASMTLMSGGEQALTATALIFAVFMANPAPVCVLDEVDAPLDDANVERFCNMLHQMAEETETRFIIITHHALTMSRMDRLYGVTMIERGVSQLVSVDLSSAEQLVAAE